MEKKDWKTLASILFCIVFFGALVFLFFRYVFVILLPFLIGWIIAAPIYPTAVRISKKTGISKKVCSFVLLLLILLLTGFLISRIGNRIVIELERAGQWLGENGELVAKRADEILSSFISLGDRIPILNQLEKTELLNGIIENIDSLLTRIWEGVMDSISRAIPEIAGGIARSLPSALLFAGVTVISSFYFAGDMDVVNKSVKSVLPRSVSKHLPFLKERVFFTLKKYLKAYLLLFLITFTELLLGFWILGVDYAMLLALAVAAVDFLPVFGTGTVLVPWAVILFFSKNYFLGFGLLVLYAVISVVRQIAEPKILGKSFGLHPLLTLVGIYAGYRLFGFWGMIAIPLLLAIATSILRGEAGHAGAKKTIPDR